MEAKSLRMLLERGKGTHQGRVGLRSGTCQTLKRLCGRHLDPDRTRPEGWGLLVLLATADWRK